jgi:hypothetical protein
MKRKRYNPEDVNPYDLGQLGMGYNQPCPRCGKGIDRRSSPYESIGFIDYCRCH